LRDSTSEQAIITATISDDVETNRKSTCRLAPDGDLRSVTAECPDILLHPLKSETLISHAHIGAILGNEIAALHEAPGGDTIVHLNSC
jgi:hypothetical protein